MDPYRIAAGQNTISDKIRALNAAGVARADIARIVERKYQHVRNVLEADRIKKQRRSVTAAPTASDKPKTPTGSIFRLEVARDGTLVIPSDVVRRLGAESGGVIVGQLDGDRLQMMSARTSLRRAQKLVARLVGPGESMAAELIRDRRKEAKHG